MSEALISVGLDVGTTSTQMVVSRLTVENRASAFTVPDMAITGREILYRSGIHFTPLLEENRMDGDALRILVEEEYRHAGITRDTVDTGAVIVTGETSRRENARTVLHALSDLAGDFVVAAAGPDLESILAARGAGAVARSAASGETVLHMDIGGGTSNLALIRDEEIVRTGCLNVGGRLIKFDTDGSVSYVSPVLSGLTDLAPGSRPALSRLQELADLLTQALEMAAGLLPPEPLLEQLTTRETGRPWLPPEEPVILSFSGGVADCIARDFPSLAFGDLGPLLGRAIRESLLCRGPHFLGTETIRATVIGAGSHSVQLSGSTVFHRNMTFPLKNIPVSCRMEPPAEGEFRILALPGLPSPTYSQITALAERLIRQYGGPYWICLEQDMAKALGQALAARLPEGTPILCLDRIRVTEDSYLDVAAPVGSALPVVVKTLIFSDNGRSIL